MSHETDFHQFMLYTPVPGTPLYAEMTEQGRMLDDVDLADIHGQHKFNFEHAAISRDESKGFLDCGVPARLRAQRPEPVSHLPHDAGRLEALQELIRIRACARASSGKCARCKNAYSGLLWAMEQRLRRTNEAVSQQVRALRKELGREFGLVSRVTARLLGPVLLWTSAREEKRLAAGKTYEPETFIERRNWVEA